MSSIADAFGKLKQFVVDEFHKVEGGVAAFVNKFEPIIENDIDALVTQFGPVIGQLVVGLATMSLGGPAKLAAASAGLVAQAEDAGIALSKTMANTLIQQAVATAGSIVAQSVVTSKPVGN